MSRPFRHLDLAGGCGVEDDGRLMLTGWRTCPRLVLRIVGGTGSSLSTSITAFFEAGSLLVAPFFSTLRFTFDRDAGVVELR